MADEKIKFNNFRSVLKDPKKRLVFILGFVVVAIGVSAAISTLNRRPAAHDESGAGGGVAPLPNLQVGQAAQQTDTPVYDKLLKEANKSGAEQAKESGGSFVTTMRPPVDKSFAEKTLPASQVSATATATPQYVDNVQQRDEEKRRDAEVKSLEQAMKGQVNLLISSWSPKPHVNQQIEVAKAEVPASPAGAAGNQAAVSAAQPAEAQGKTIKKAGDTCYAELNSFASTDEPSPIWATIYGCEDLNKSVITGTIEVPNSQYSQSVRLHFTTINIPNQPNSLKVDIYAINEQTRQTALASGVDNHYFLRYGSLLASGFLSGYSDALMQKGQNQNIVTTASGAIVQNTAFTNTQLAEAGIANVGKQAASNMGSVFNRPATITVGCNPNGPKNCHYGMGIIFMSDLTLK